LNNLEFVYDSDWGYMASYRGYSISVGSSGFDLTYCEDDDDHGVMVFLSDVTYEQFCSDPDWVCDPFPREVFDLLVAKMRDCESDEEADLDHKIDEQILRDFRHSHFHAD